MTQIFKSQNEIMPIRIISSAALVSEIKIGWNLGNTLDARKHHGELMNDTSSETAWGNPVTTIEMIRTIKEKGFNIVRVPVTWEGHLAPDYMIDEIWMNRVAEVVEYVLDNDMFCILNTHHEEWLYPRYEKEKENSKTLQAIWKQIAERFKGYDEKLIFEGMNEPRMRGTEYEWNGGNKEGRETVNKLNAVFINTVRSSGGNNPHRHLMIPSYAASCSPEAYNELIIPANDDKIIVSIHAYTPYGMALDAESSGLWFPDKVDSTEPIYELFNGLKEAFTDKGIPVIIGEMGVRDKDNLTSRVLWAEYYIGLSREYGIPCVWWDNGAFSGNGERFGLLDRTGLKWAFPELVDVLVKTAYR